MNELERTLRALLEGKEVDEEMNVDGLNTFAPSNTMALNDDNALARALGASTLNGNQI